MKIVTIFTGIIFFFVLNANAQNVAGKYSNSQSTWEFIETSVSQEFQYKGYSTAGTLNAVGSAFYSKKQSSIVVVFKRIDNMDDIGYAVCKVNGNTIQVKTLNPDGSVRWTGGTLTKK